MAIRKLSRIIRFQQPPDVGFVVMRESQRYELIVRKPHVRKDGQPTTLLIWRSHCCDCGEVFEVITGLVANGYFNRRCSDHHQPGRAVMVAGRKYQKRIVSQKPKRRKSRA